MKIKLDECEKFQAVLFDIDGVLEFQGKAYPVAAAETTPFAQVTPFDADFTVVVAKDGSMAELVAALTAAIREVKEETGLDVEIRSILSVVSNFLSPRLHTLAIVLLARAVGRLLGLRAVPRLLERARERGVGF